MVLTAGYLKIVKVLKTIATTAKVIRVTSKSLLSNFKKTAAALGGKIYKVIVFAAQGVRAAVVATAGALKSVAKTLGGAFMKVLKGMRIAANFIRVTAIPMLMTTLMTVGTTLMAAMAPFLPIVLIVAAAIGAVVGIFLLIQKSIEGLGLGSMSDLMTVVFAGMKDGVNHFLNMFIKIGKKIGEVGGTIAKALGFEVPEFLTNMAEMEYFDTDNASKALTEGQLKNREAIEKKAKKLGWEEMYAELKKIDLRAANNINKNDKQRIQRALEVYYITGKKISELQEKTTPQNDYQFEIFSLKNINRDELYLKINNRFLDMLDAGFVDEVRILREREGLSSEHMSMRSVGYRQIWKYLDNEIDLNEAIELAQTATRQIAKRQLTWMRSMKNLKLESHKNIYKKFESLI